MITAEVRSAFLKYFEARQHRIVPSDSLIPSTDPSLLFTSAGMVQFKPYFSNAAASPYRRAASCQKCLRTSDIERVGHTLRHLTFFEMLGNFSFGDYFKKEAIGWAWEFLVGVLRLPAERLTISVHKNDSEALALWEKLVPSGRVALLGDETNFWAMGPTGPCGPCSEVLWDRGPAWSCGRSTCGPACDCDRYLEIWNLVFTQFDRRADGRLNPLPQKNIDTGMGLERLSLVLQGVASPFDTDGFQPILHALAELSGRKPPSSDQQPGVPSPETESFRRIADHCRSMTFLITDGVLPSNEGRGYVLRRLLRQAVRAGKTLGFEEPFLYRLTGAVVDAARSAYPDILQRRETIASLVRMEEKKFLETLDTGTRLLEDLVKAAKTQGRTALPGKDLFQLYDTYGFPFELTREMAEGFGLEVDAVGFETARKQAVELARQAWRGSGAQDIVHYRQWKAKMSSASQFLGYSAQETSTKILAPLYKRTSTGWEETSQLQSGDGGAIVLGETPFYPEGGGQVGDHGWLETPEARAEVLDTQAPVEGLIVHTVRVLRGILNAGSAVKAVVDRERREATMRHHTATHLLHKALREVLGPHVTQSGSLVEPDRLRFDFTHSAALSAEERRRVEELVNEKIMLNLGVQPHEVSLQESREAGAMALFGEKYGDRVRCVMISPQGWVHAKEAWSLELCGGTHVSATGQIGFFKILSENGISTGVRRMEAIAGKAALSMVRRMERQIAVLSETLGTSPDEVLPRVERLLARNRDLEKDLKTMHSGAIRGQFEDIVRSARSVGGINVIRHRVDGLDEKQMREFADRLRDSAQAGVVALCSVKQGKISFVVAVSREVTERGIHANRLAKEFAALIQGSAGGRVDFAQGGGKDSGDIDRALQEIEEMIKKMVIKNRPSPPPRQTSGGGEDAG